MTLRAKFRAAMDRSPASLNQFYSDESESRKKLDGPRLVDLDQNDE
jgi:hypothetical protein